ncbi:MAG: hypothetical protein A4E28_02477 [Methanocella sp. PtaU1.Bin125]|nr:MAG: hypothetical protein A4E28_02477 [Methanocella sp. PtaU1.Bin125]
MSTALCSTDGFSSGAAGWNHIWMKRIGSVGLSLISEWYMPLPTVVCCTHPFFRTPPRPRSSAWRKTPPAQYVTTSISS